MKSKSIAVLPFVSMSNQEENEFFCDGITEEIINALTKIDDLKVTSRTSSFFFKNKNIPIQQIGDKLDVSILLEGSVRRSGDTLRITAQLIHAKEDFHFWSETWDRKMDSIFEIQDEVSLLIAEKLREFVGHFEIQSQLVSKQTDSVLAYEFFLKGRFHFRKWNPADSKTAIEYYEKALSYDSNHAESLLGLADCYSFLGTTGFIPFEEAWSKARNYTEQGIQNNDQLAAGQYLLANISFFVDSNYSASLDAAHKAIELQESYSEAQQFLSFLYIIAGDQKKAKLHLQKALDIDPLSQETLFFSGYYDYMCKNYTSALQKLEACIKANELNIPAHTVKCYCLLKSGRHQETLNYFDHLPKEVLVEEDQFGITALSYAYDNNEEKAISYLQELEQRALKPEGFRSNSFLPFMYCAMGDEKKAILWYEKAIQQKTFLLYLHYSDPLVEEITTDSYHKSLHKELFKVNSPVYSFSTVQKRQKISVDQLNQFTKKITAHLTSNQPYLDSSLSLNSLADQLHFHPNILSFVINEAFEKNFNELINLYRIDYFKKIAKEEKNKQLTILALAYDSGFNSKTVFNTYFKKVTGQTPKAYLTST